MSPGCPGVGQPAPQLWRHLLSSLLAFCGSAACLQQCSSMKAAKKSLLPWCNHCTLLFVACGGAWSTATHRHWPAAFKAAARTLLLAQAGAELPVAPAGGGKRGLHL